VNCLHFPAPIILLIGACISLVGGCGTVGSPQPFPASAPADRATAEAGVYKVLTDSVYRRDTSSPAIVVVVDETVAPQGYGPRSATQLVDVLARILTPESTSNFWSVNETPSRLSEVMGPLAPVLFQFVVEQEIEKLLRDSEWDTFHRRFQGSAGFLRFSRVGMDPSMTEALIYFEHRAGLLGGSGGYAVLEHRQGSWEIRTIYFIWQS
jgi:hypothetical protein